jgi:predicted alpha/beta hydrolase
MEKTQSLTPIDGATISYRSTGSGLSVIVIPGGLSVAADYATFANLLAETSTVHTIERRGRGQSSPQDTKYWRSSATMYVRCKEKRMRVACLGIAMAVSLRWRRRGTPRWCGKSPFTNLVFP